MSNDQKVPPLAHPLIFSSFRNWLYLLFEGWPVSPQFLGRALVATVVSMLTIPLRIYETIRYKSFFKSYELKEDPIFILGHWRSGTTHLHNLMALDEQLTYVTTFQILAPGFFLSGQKFIKPILSKIMPKKRMMDNMTITVDSPQEEEYAIANTLPYSTYLMWTFPRKSLYYFRKYALFERFSEKQLAKWKSVYLDILKKATYYGNGRRLIIKNPSLTGKIPVLLEMFPNAKFIHIHRDPYRIFVSTNNLHQTTSAVAELQTSTQTERDEHVLLIYKEMMQKFLHDKEAIPEGNFVEVSFDELVQNPSGTIETIYTQLKIDNLTQLQESMGGYLKSKAQKEYKKNKYQIDDKMIKRINKEWGFAFSAWDYPIADQEEIDGVIGN